jgi:diketogulonate reductase-like aldo/keto reductase
MIGGRRRVDVASGRVTLATGTEMPVLGLGTWQLTGRAAREGVEHALEIGYRLIDTSGDYGNQPQIREAVRSSGVAREEVFLVSKVEEDEDAYASARDKVEELGVERLDLCLIHRPPPTGAGESLWEGLIAAKGGGLAREIGVSNYSIGQIDRLVEATGEQPVVNQIEWSPFGYSEEVAVHARRRELVLQAYSPLTRGKRLGDETLNGVGARHGKSAAQVLLRWNVQRGTAPVPKAASPEHREENVDVFDFELGEDELGRLDRLNEHWSSLAGLPYV